MKRFQSSSHSTEVMAFCTTIVHAHGGSVSGGGRVNGVPSVRRGLFVFVKLLVWAAILAWALGSLVGVW